jgi:hypothetical protein
MKERSFFSHNVRDRRNTRTETENKREGEQKEREREAPQNHFLFFLKELFPSFFSPPLSDRENNYLSLQNYISSLKEPHTITQRECFCATLINTHTRTPHSITSLSLSLERDDERVSAAAKGKEYITLSFSNHHQREKNPPIFDQKTRKYYNQRKKNSHEEEQKEY